MRLTKVLIVDDSPALQQTYKVLLSRYRCQTISALNGQEGLNLLAENPDLDLLIVDIGMPAMGGLEFIQKVKGQRPCSKVPILLVSVKGREREVQEAVPLVQGHVVKPFTSNEIHQVIEGLFSHNEPAADP